MRCENVMFLPPILISRIPAMRSPTASSRAVPVAICGLAQTRRIAVIEMTALKGGVAKDRKEGVDVSEVHAALLPRRGVAQVFLEVRHDGPCRDPIEAGLAQIGRASC